MICHSAIGMHQQIQNQELFNSNNNLFSELSKGSKTTQRKRAELTNRFGDCNEGDTEVT